MKIKQQAWWIAAVSGGCRLGRALEAQAKEESGVTAIEYALLASLIAVGAAASIALLGGGVGGMWARVADAVVAAI